MTADPGRLEQVVGDFNKWVRKSREAFATDVCVYVVCAFRPPSSICGTLHLFRSWNTDLRLFSHDCRHYCSALLTKLTGREVSIEDLQDLVAASRLPPSS